MVAVEQEQLVSVLDLDGLCEQLQSRSTPAFEKREALNALAALGGPRAVQALRAYLAEPDVGLERHAEQALRQALESGGGDRNSACAYGSGSKWKHCCGRERTCWADERRTLRAGVNAPWR